MFHPDGRETQHINAESALRALDETFFTTYGMKLGRVKVFQYPRRELCYDDNNTHAIRNNTRKARAMGADSCM